MAMRSRWKGCLKPGLVSVPVQAFNRTASSDGEIHFNQLHTICDGRYPKVCPIQGEVSQDAIVSGYEYAMGQYTIMEPAAFEDESKAAEVSKQKIKLAEMLIDASTAEEFAFSK